MSSSAIVHGRPAGRDPVISPSPSARAREDAWEAFKRGPMDQSQPPFDQARRRFLAVAARASLAGALAGISTAVDPAFALIAAHRVAEVAHCKVIDAQDEAEARYGIRSDEAWEAADRCEAMCDEINAIAWKLATTPPTTLAGVAAVLQFANEVEDAGGDWPLLGVPIWKLG